MKRYSYKTKKLYESVQVYGMELVKYDADGNNIDEMKSVKTFDTVEDAFEEAYRDITEYAKDNGIDQHDITWERDENSVTFELPDGEQWVYTLNVSTKDVELERMDNVQSRSAIIDDVTDVDESVDNHLSKRNKMFESVANDNWILVKIQKAGSKDTFIVSHSVSEAIRTFIRMHKGEYIDKNDVLNKCEVSKVETFYSLWDYLPDDSDYNDKLYVVGAYSDVDKEEIYIMAKTGSDALEKIKNLFPDEKLRLGAPEEVGGYGGYDVFIDRGTNESVAERFSRLRQMFESDNLNEKDDDDDENVEGSSEDPDAKETGEPDDNNDEKDDDNDNNNDNEEDSDEDQDMKAVIITVKKGDEDKCKDELVDAGIAEDDIEILEAGEDDENVDIRIDVNSVMELKDYLEKKGIDLEKEIGGEIVTDDEEGEGDEEGDEDKDGEGEGEGDEEDFDFDNLGDIFGAGEDEGEEK